MKTIFMFKSLDAEDRCVNHLDMTSSEHMFTSWVKPRVGEDPDAARNMWQRKPGATRREQKCKLAPEATTRPRDQHCRIPNLHDFSFLR